MKKKILFIIGIMCFTNTFTVSAEELNIQVSENLNESISITKYYNTITYYDNNNNPIDSTSYEITEDEYIKDNSQNLDVLPYASATHESAKKRITLTVGPGGGSGAYSVDINVNWKELPNVRLFDVIGFRIGDESGISINKRVFNAKQIYDGKQIIYDGNSNNLIVRDKGAAYVMNIVNDINNNLSINMNGQFISSGTVNVFATYQHAVDSSITATEAKSLRFGGYPAASGKKVLGNTLVYDSNIGNKYDDMGGVNLRYSPFSDLT